MTLGPSDFEPLPLPQRHPWERPDLPSPGSDHGMTPEQIVGGFRAHYQRFVAAVVAGTEHDQTSAMPPKAVSVYADVPGWQESQDRATAADQNNIGNHVGATQQALETFIHDSDPDLCLELWATELRHSYNGEENAGSVQSSVGKMGDAEAAASTAQLQADRWGALEQASHRGVPATRRRGRSEKWFPRNTNMPFDFDGGLDDAIRLEYDASTPHRKNPNIARFLPRPLRFPVRRAERTWGDDTAEQVNRQQAAAGVGILATHALIDADRARDRAQTADHQAHLTLGAQNALMQHYLEVADKRDQLRQAVAGEIAALAGQIDTWPLGAPNDQHGPTITACGESLIHTMQVVNELNGTLRKEAFTAWVSQAARFYGRLSVEPGNPYSTSYPRFAPDGSVEVMAANASVTRLYRDGSTARQTSEGAWLRTDARGKAINPPARREAVLPGITFDRWRSNGQFDVAGIARPPQDQTKRLRQDDTPSVAETYKSALEQWDRVATARMAATVQSAAEVLCERLAEEYDQGRGLYTQLSDRIVQLTGEMDAADDDARVKLQEQINDITVQQRLVADQMRLTGRTLTSTVHTVAMVTAERSTGVSVTPGGGIKLHSATFYGKSGQWLLLPGGNAFLYDEARQRYNEVSPAH